MSFQCLHLDPAKRSFLNLETIFMEPMPLSNHTRVLIYLSATLSIFDEPDTPSFRSHTSRGGLIPPTFLDRSM